MPIEPWLAFAAASATLLLIPGPTVMLVAGYAMAGGRRTGWATVPGVTLGDFTAMTVSLAGAGAVLAASAELFTALKLVGAVYLVWLGIGLWRHPARLDALARRRTTPSPRRMFRDAFVITALNPKSLLFFIAFVPQFVDPAGPALPQLAILEATFVTLAALNAALWAALVGEMRARFSAPAQRWAGRIGGGVLIAAGLATALARRAG